MANELTDFGNRIAKIADSSSLKRIVAAGGMAGKESALQAASRDLGGDRAFSGLRRKAPLGAGYDARGGTMVEINFRPAGLWRLAESGRRGTKPIRPRRARALRTPLGFRGGSTSTPSRGLHTFTDAVRDAQREVPKAAHKQFVAEIRKVIH